MTKRKKLAGGRTVPTGLPGRKMKYSGVTRIEVDEATWRTFRGMCIERGLFVPEALGALVRGSVKSWASKRPRRVYERRG